MIVKGKINKITIDNKPVYIGSSLYVNKKHKSLYKYICNLILYVFGYKIESVFNEETNKLVRYNLRKLR